MSSAITGTRGSKSETPDLALYQQVSVIIMSIAPLKFLTVPAAAKHTATVIFVHGLGDSGHGWKPVADMFKTEPSLRHIKWILPHAPTIPITANMGMEMPGWFDIYSFGFKGVEDEDGMLQTVATLQTIINTEIEQSNISSDRIVLGGFSQGGAMSLLTGLTSKDHKLGGIVSLSGWLPMNAKVQAVSLIYTCPPIYHSCLYDHRCSLPMQLPCPYL